MEFVKHEVYGICSFEHYSKTRLCHAEGLGEIIPPRQRRTEFGTLRLMVMLWIRTKSRALARPSGVVMAAAACLLSSLLPLSAADASKMASAKGDASIQVRRFSIPQDFLSIGSADQASSPADPFAAQPFAPADTPSEPQFPRAKSAQELLAEQGIPFPQGTNAVFDSATSTLVVRNTPENLQLIESFVDSIRGQAPKLLSLTLHLIEAPVPLLRLLADPPPNGDLTTGLQRLIQTATTQPNSGVRILTTGFLETKSGQRCTLEADTEYTYATEVALDKQGRSSVVSEMRPLGFRVEVDPVIEADGKIIDLNLAPEYTTAPPESRQETVEEPVTGSALEFPVTQFHTGKVQTSLTMASGTTRLVGLWKAPENRPNDDRDLQQAVFLTAHVVRVGAPSPSAADQTSLSLSARSDEELTRTFDVPVDSFTGSGPLPSPAQIKAALVAAGIPLTPTSTARWNDKGQLEVRAPVGALEIVASSIDTLWQLTPKNLSFQVEIFRAHAPLVREILAENASRDDHTSALTQLQGAAATGQAQSLSSLFFETKSGQRAANESVLQLSFISELAWDQARHPTVSTEQRRVGTSMELDPVLGADGRTIDLNLSLEYQPAPPSPRRETFTDPASKQRFDFPRDDFHVEKVQTAIALMSGARKILYVCKPPGNTAGDKDVLDIAMLTSHVVPATPPATAPPPAPADKPKASAENGDPNEMILRMYRVPPDFLSIGAPAPATPANEGQMIKRITALETLKEQGILFPDGSSAVFNPVTSQLIVRNTRANHALVETFVDSIMVSAPKDIVLTIHLFEGDGTLLRPLVAAAGNRADHHAELTRLLDLTKTGQIKPLGTLNLNTQSGQRATVEQVQEHTYVTGTEINDKGEPSVVQDMTPVGLRVEVDPVVGADGYTLDLNLALDYDPAPPILHRESFSHPNGERHTDFPLTDFHHAKVLTALTLTDGTARILSLWKPTGKPEFDSQDRLQIAILEGKLVRVEAGNSSK